jgi:hypothetical protein
VGLHIMCVMGGASQHRAGTAAQQGKPHIQVGTFEQECAICVSCSVWTCVSASACALVCKGSACCVYVQANSDKQACTCMCTRACMRVSACVHAHSCGHVHARLFGVRTVRAAGESSSHNPQLIPVRPVLIVLLLGCDAGGMGRWCAGVLRCFRSSRQRIGRCEKLCWVLGGGVAWD